MRISKIRMNSLGLRFLSTRNLKGALSRLEWALPGLGGSFGKRTLLPKMAYQALVGSRQTSLEMTQWALSDVDGAPAMLRMARLCLEWSLLARRERSSAWGSLRSEMDL